MSGPGAQHGYYRDPETGLYLLTHRYYDPETGRFLTRDPIGYPGSEGAVGPRLPPAPWDAAPG